MSSTPFFHLTERRPRARTCGSPAPMSRMLSTRSRCPRTNGVSSVPPSPGGSMCFRWWCSAPCPHPRLGA
eukprot:11206384-Lingulodinium_polyedra.AAC.1